MITDKKVKQMPKPINILYVSDGKAGHRSQALGFYQAIKNKSANTTFQEIHIQQLHYKTLFKHLFLGQGLPELNEHIDYILGVGSHTHLKVLLLSKIYRCAKSIILMKTSLPLAWFDYHIIPQHDLAKVSRSNIILTQGVLNPIINQQQHQQGRILIALGGSSKRHQWQDDEMKAQLVHLIQQYPEQEIIITTSRRTPSDFLVQLQTQFPQQDYPNIQYFPVEQTPQGWIFEQMQLAETVWVTEDSVSMIFEALTSGANVGILQAKRLKSDRITQMLDELLTQPQPIKMQLNEAERVAEWIMQGA